MVGQEFRGAGWKFTVHLDDGGEVAPSRHKEDIREAIWIIFGTAPG